MLSMVHMESMVLDTALILWDMVMAISATLLLAMAVDMVLAMVLMVMESVMLMLNQRPMLSMEPMVGMDMDTDMAMVMDMDIMVELSDTTNQDWHYNDYVSPQCIMVRIYFLVCFKYRLNFQK